MTFHSGSEVVFWGPGSIFPPYPCLHSSLRPFVHSFLHSSIHTLSMWLYLPSRLQSACRFFSPHNSREVLFVCSTLLNFQKYRLYHDLTATFIVIWANRFSSGMTTSGGQQSSSGFSQTDNQQVCYRCESSIESFFFLLLFGFVDFSSSVLRASISSYHGLIDWLMNSAARSCMYFFQYPCFSAWLFWSINAELSCITLPERPHSWSRTASCCDTFTPFFARYRCHLQQWCWGFTRE